ncbi:MAG: vitamin K epoxide reductase family protein [Bacteroidota bacterium]
MNKKRFDDIIDYWLKTHFGISYGKFLIYKLSSEQSFLNIFDLLFALFKEINLKHIVVSAKTLPKEEFKHIPFPALIINYQMEDETPVLGKVELIDHEKMLGSRDRFLVVIAEKSKSNSIALKDIYLGAIRNFKKELLVGIFSILLVIGSIFDFFQLHGQIIYCLCLFGLYISHDLLDEENELQNKGSLVRKICGGGNANPISDCKKLSGQSSKVFNYLEWSEIGIFYFLGIILNIVVIASGEFYFLMYYLVLSTSFLGILFSFYSLYQQVKLKLFCKICSIIILVFYAVFGISYVVLSELAFDFQFDNRLIFPILAIGLYFLLSLAYVLLTKGWNSVKQNYSYTRKRLMEFYTDSEVFARINDFRMREDDLSFLNDNTSILHSSAESDNTLTAFVCTHCPYCNQTLKEINENLVGSNIEIRIAHIPTQIGYQTEEDAILHAGVMIAVLETYGIERYVDLFEFNQKVNSDSEIVLNEINTNYPVEADLVNDSIIAATNILKITKANDLKRYPTLMLNDIVISSLYPLEALSLHI